MPNRIIEIQKRLDKKYESGFHRSRAGTFSFFGQGARPLPTNVKAMSSPARQYEQIVEQVRKELQLPFSDPNDPRLLERRQRLKDLFARVPDSFAKALYDRLGMSATGDELSKSFHGRLATATRMELLEILSRKIPSSTSPSPPASTQPALVWPDRPLPASESARFSVALSKLEALVRASNDPRKWRYECWFGKLKQPNVDDRLIEWSRICPATSGAIGAAYIVGPCDVVSGMPVSQDKIQKSIRSVADVDTVGQLIGIITHLKADIVVASEMTALPLENLRMTHDRVQEAIEKLGEWANNPMGGSSAMPQAYVAIKDWIGQHQRDPNSLYSCM